MTNAVPQPKVPAGHINTTANAHLIRKHGNYFLKITTFSKPETKPSEGIIGIDVGCATQLTLSNGTKIEFQTSVPKTIRKLDRIIARKRARRKKYSSGQYVFGPIPGYSGLGCAQ